jgi:hypothetical protein
MAKKDNNNLKFIVPAIVGLGAGAAFLAKKVSLPGIEKKKSLKGKLHNVTNRLKHGEVVEVSIEPSEYDPEEIRNYIADNICVKEITEQDWMMGGAKLLFSAIESNYNHMIKKNGLDIETPVWHGYVAVTEGDAAYILKAAKESKEEIYVFWEEKTGFVFGLNEGLDYLLQLKCGLTDDDYEKQGVKYMNYMGLMEVLIESMNIELNEDTDLEAILEERILEKYFEANEACGEN